MVGKILEFVEYVKNTSALKGKNVDLIFFDLDRVYLAVDSTENNYNIRMWNINEKGIRYSLFKDSEEIIKSNYYEFKS